MNYSEKLRDPRWQKRRLKMLEEAGFKCQSCGEEKRELHVHHLNYHGEPWEASSDELVVLCDGCHRIVPSLVAKFNKELITSVGVDGLAKFKPTPIGGDLLAEKLALTEWLQELRDYLIWDNGVSAGEKTPAFAVGTVGNSVLQ